MTGESNPRKKQNNAMFWCLVVLVIALSTPGQVYGFDDTFKNLENTLPAYAVALIGEEALNSSTCARELGIFGRAIENQKLWALKMLDASGEPKPGFIYGNNYWLGSRSQCIDTTNDAPFLLKKEIMRNWTRFRKPEDERSPFDLNYFVAHFRHNSTLQYHVRLPNEDLVTLGLCLPSSCTTDELSSTLKRVFQERILTIGRLYAADFRLENVRDLKDDHLWLLNGRFIIVGVILLLTFCAMIVGTMYDLVIYQKYLKAKKASAGNERIKNRYGLKTTMRNAESFVPTLFKRPSMLGEILKSFSVYTNTKIIFNTKLGSDAVAPIHGLRFLGMVWIIMVHTIFYVSDVSDNKPWSWRMAEGLAMQIVSNATLAVDTYFFLSGFLVAYLYYKTSLKTAIKDSHKINYKSKAKQFFGALVKRFIRLTPAYMLMIGIVEINHSWYGVTSQFYMTERPQDTCSKYWWRNLLYINNFFGRDTMCLSWSWYLSNDMQFFVIGTFLVILSSVYFYAALSILVCVLFGSTIVTGYVSYIYGYTPTMDEQLSMLELLYDPPWTRIGPYIVGIVTAYILVKLKNKLILGRKTLVILWILGSSCNLFVLFGLYDRNISVLLSSIYVAVSRTVWGVGIAWLLIACCTNHASTINSVLTFRAWIPLSRLTYCAYLLNPFIITSIYLHSETSSHIDFLPNGTMFLGNLTITYLCSYAYSLMMETPYVLIMRLLTKPRSQSR